MFRMTIDDVFVIRGRGVVATGRVESGQLRVGDEVHINGGERVRVDAIEAFRRRLDETTAGDTIGVLFSKLNKTAIARGDVLSSSFVL
ncbi:MAG: EF-Tu/IF-2/RF-3 family GTPase [Candidatus Sericytochromatia bacterium]